MSFTEWMACIRPITPVLFVEFCDGACALTREDKSSSDPAMTERIRIGFSFVCRRIHLRFVNCHRVCHPACGHSESARFGPMTVHTRRNGLIGVEGSSCRNQARTRRIV